jgi:predicted dehydrogenase
MMSGERLRAAVVGTGFVGPFHVDAVRRGGYGEVVVVVGSDPERTARKARALGVARATTDLAEVLDDPQVDVVHVCTPNDTHVEIGRRAMLAGKHVVVEKPLALTSADARSLEQLAAECGLHAAVAFTYRGYPMIRRARQLVADGEIGSLRLIHGGYLQDWLANETDFNWRLEPEAGQSRAVADIGSHWFDAAEHVSGLRINAVLADFATFLAQRRRPSVRTEAFEEASGEGEPVAIDSEDAATILLRFEGGARGAVVVSQVSPGRKNAFTLELAGSRASLAWAQEEPERIWLGSRQEQRTLVRDAISERVGVPSLPAGHPEGWAEALRDLLRGFYAAVASGLPPAEPGTDPGYPTLGAGTRAVSLVEAVVASARSGAWTSV